MNGQKRVLNHVVDPVGGNAASPRGALDNAGAFPQQGDIGCLIASLRRRHKGREPKVFRTPMRFRLAHAFRLDIRCRMAKGYTDTLRSRDGRWGAAVAAVSFSRPFA